MAVNLRLRRVSDETVELLSRLRALCASKAWWHQGEKLDLLGRIEGAGEPGVIPPLMAFGFTGNREIRDSVREVIRQLFSLVPWEALPVIDEDLRSHYLPEWYDGDPGKIERMEKKSDADRLCIAFLSCHPSGYIRCEALRNMAGDPAELTMPFVLMRLVDWVAPVKALAEAEFRKRLVVENAAVVVRCIALLERLGKETRFDAQYMEWVGSLLQDPKCAASVQQGIDGGSLPVRRRCFRIAAVNPAFAGADLLRRALKDPDVVVRKWAYSAGATFGDASQAELMQEAAKDPYGPIRRMAFQYFEAAADQWRDDLKPFLLDGSTGIRRDCQAVWTKRLGESPAEVYRKTIDLGSARVAIAVLGLGETGDQKDANMIRGLLRTGSARVRAAAIRALRMINEACRRDELLRVVETDVPSVAREAAWSLMAAREVTADVIWEAARKNGDAQVRAAVVSMAVGAGKWVRLRLYLEAAGSGETHLVERATKSLGTWILHFNKSFAQPSREDVEVARVLLERARASLPVDLADGLGLILKDA